MQLSQRTQLEVDQSKPSENQSSDGLLVSCVRLRRCLRLIVLTRAISRAKPTLRGCVGTIRLQAVIVRMRLSQRTQLEVDQSRPSENQSSDGLFVSCVRLRHCRRLIAPTRAMTHVLFLLSSITLEIRTTFILHLLLPIYL